MNNTIKELFDRKSVRVFTDKEISKEDKELILNSAMQAPTAGNQQMYTIIDVTDQAVKDSLVKTCDNQPFIATGKMVLIFCADFYKWYKVFEESGCSPRAPGVGDLMIAVSDANIAAQNAVVAAHSLGIGSCYIGDIMENYEEQRKLLGLPDFVLPCAMLVFGYPTEQQLARPKPQRFNLEDIVHKNKYNLMSKEERIEMFKTHTKDKDFNDWMRRFCDFKYESDFSKEMTRSVKKYIDDFSGE
ncbi:MAG: nitroreductase family protein [Bacilli bacterium]|nr:nitroreductase family protein [Bacilli bacterium]